MEVVSTILPNTRTRNARSTRSQQFLPRMERDALIQTMKCLVRQVAAVSLSTGLELGTPMVHAFMILRITRTGDADTTRSAQMLPTMDLAALITITISSAPLVVALNQWIAWELGVRMEHANTLP